ncbi:MAG: PEP-CTERM sorting domain-containing protein [Verrucomicrobia bacterium]|nr:PEP-CTERM sorting domain-containing protein [Verrucomicrobiota bacterium]MDA1069141.1 PEP-CTERM sorting domain-containing protein [Verrucomicrobiota bacterium]
MNKVFALLTLLVFSVSLSGQFSITTFNSNITVDDFDSFTGAGFSPTPSAGQLNSNIWSTSGWSDGDVGFGGAGTTGDFARGTDPDGVVTGGVYGFDIGGGDIILGVQPGGTDFTPGDFRLKLVNNTGATIINLTVDYDVVVYNDQGKANSFNFSHSSTNSTFTDIGALDFASTETADGSPAWISADRNTTITGISIANGAEYFLRWNGDEISGSGSMDQFGLNNVVINASGIPEPSTYALIFGGLALGIVILKRRKTASL